MKEGRIICKTKRTMAIFAIQIMIIPLLLLAFCSAIVAWAPRTIICRRNNNLNRLPTSEEEPLSISRSLLLSASSVRLHGQHPNRQDIQVSFGSETDDDDEKEGEEGDEEKERVISQRQRQATIDSYLEKEDAAYREERRQKLWGDYANATSKEDLQQIEKVQKERIADENRRKAELARKQGVEFEVLEPLESSIQDGKDLLIQIGSAESSKKYFFEKVDKDLQREWNAMEEGNENADDNAVARSTFIDAVEVDGKMVSRDSLAGVRVGSAGGWELEIFPSDYVVHRKYGIGRFEKTVLRPKTKLTKEEEAARDARRAELLRDAIKSIPGGATPQKIQEIRAKFGTEEDTDPVSNPQYTVLEIAYADGLVHVPVDRAYRLSRYRAGDAAVKPRLSRVKGEAWRRAREKVEESTLQMAQDVLALYATRETLQRQPFDPTKEPLVKEFGKTFAYEPTPDQKKCFEDIENDMVWRGRPMDRLVCGDVGFGKTEVAMRALYRAVVNGRQAILLAPTGVLAAQHFKTVSRRMGENTQFNFNIALLRGGTNKNTKAGRELRKLIADGKVDVVVGTHSVLSRDMSFSPKLSLLVIDEEQRFGVKQKERLKLISSGIDVLTLSATPIPRTLQMSLSGIRDTSTIRSPPPMRKPVKSFVQDFNEDIVRHAVEQELDRGGQIYYVVPRIAMISEAENMLKELFPDIRVIQAHGRMSKNGAEANVESFAEGNYDVLLATTVIENGVDIPSVNTIIIQNSQAFGMSTLYQLRGRVGRSDKQAYAYFLHREESVTEQAMLRLQAISELSDLGSGFDVANRDLEIRGAGSLLGTEQSGVASKVGFDLYMRMLKKSIRQLRGLDLPTIPRTNVLLPRGQGSLEVKKKTKDGIVLANLFQIPEFYIPAETDRLKQETAARLAESTSTLVDLTNQWKEAYGPLPANLQAKLKTMHFHACTRRLGIDLVGLVENDNGSLDCVLRSPGLRPRHLSMIIPGLPKEVLTPGLSVVFPKRFSKKDIEIRIDGAKKYDFTTILEDPSVNDEDAENWDALDEEEIEAMKDISSAYDISSMNEVDLEYYPRFIVKDFGDGPKAVDKLLKVLLPSAKIVFERQEKDKEVAKQATQLRDKREEMKQKRKELDKLEIQRTYLR